MKSLLIFKKNNSSTFRAGFTLIEILIVISVLLIIIASGVATLSSRTTQVSLDATSKEVVELIAQARNYAVTGYFGDAWGIIVLNNNSACVDSGDCVVMFKGESYFSRDIAYDRSVQLDRGVYIDPSETNEFYFKPVAGWLSTSTGLLAEQQVILKSNAGESETIAITASGLAYFFYCGVDEVFDADGKSYRTIQIGNQCWMAESLNTGVMLASAATNPTNNGIVEKWCNANSEANCTNSGGLYSWDELMNHQIVSGNWDYSGICPNGWHVPTSGELNILTSSYPPASNGTALKIGGISGFDLLESNEMNTDTNTYDDADLTVLWTSTENAAFTSEAHIQYVDTPTAAMAKTTNDKDWGFSVRCLKND